MSWLAEDAVLESLEAQVAYSLSRDLREKGDRLCARELHSPGR